MSSGPLSLIPIGVKEAGAAKVSTSLLVIIGIAWGAHYLGAKSNERIADVEIALVKLTVLAESAALQQKEMKENQERAARDLRAIEDRTNKMNVEMVELSSKVDGKPIR